LAQALIEVFPKNIVANLYSQKWQNRSSAVFKLKEYMATVNLSTLKSSYDRESLIVNLLSIVTRGLKDKVI